MNSKFLILALLTTIFSSCNMPAAENKEQKSVAPEISIDKTEQMIKDKCLICHVAYKKPGTHLKHLNAPPLNGIVFHLEKKFGDSASAYFDREKAVAFITDYVLYPDTSKSLCDKKRLKKYGQMPSLKGSVSPEELEEIAYFIIDSFAPKP